ncbi:uncharacterized protein F4812DRAFT_368045 [Daldinia caldariorum]|uniref:uncharacterized protein n=1 Tax=Daldinia caldariorum TaxID=326644 RepID=UPI002007EA17|nr:uncharacterized protein F4812DRAFT_368045 [Daldinia caldariorum]KAI1468424.1 hypothetical protein F4812DRAFT_368045 [Daldinia caldariorum]
MTSLFLALTLALTLISLIPFTEYITYYAVVISGTVCTYYTYSTRAAAPYPYPYLIPISHTHTCYPYMCFPVYTIAILGPIRSLITITYLHLM